MSKKGCREKGQRRPGTPGWAETGPGPACLPWARCLTLTTVLSSGFCSLTWTMSRRVNPLGAVFLCPRAGLTPGQVPKTKRRTLVVTKDWGGLVVREAVEPITLVQRTTGARTANKKEGWLCRVPPGTGEQHAAGNEDSAQRWEVQEQSCVCGHGGIY